MRSPAATIGVAVLAALAASGCASHRLRSVQPGLVDAARQRTTPALATMLESTDSPLKAALARLATDPSAQAHRAVADAYMRLGVLDLAHEHYSAAVKLDPSDAASYDARARIWRDWGMPGFGLADAYRAVHFAPESPEAANTLGTVLQAIGQRDAASQWYARALGFDSHAWYAVNNLCYLDVLMRRSTAVVLCQQAVAAAAGDARTARNNLALAYAAAGDFVSARQWFQRANDPATAAYNYGIVMMALREYGTAASAFQTALTTNPGFDLAATRERQAWEAVVAEAQR